MIEIVARQGWRARPANWTHPTVEKRDHVITMCFGKEVQPTRRETMNFLRWMQHYSTWYLEYDDIRYNFMIGEDGTAYEGRGWTEIPLLPADLKQLEKKSILIGVIGRHKVHKLPPTINQSIGDLIRYGIKNGYIETRYKRRGEINKEKDKVLLELPKPVY